MKKYFIASLAFVCAAFLILGASAADTADENINAIITDNDLLLLSSSFSGDIISALNDNSALLLSIDDIFLQTNEVKTTNGITVTSAKVCINDYTSCESNTARTYFLERHGINVTEAYENSGLGTRTYNCHAYAWYGSPGNGSYWIDDPTEFVEDIHCQEVTNECDLQVNDIIVFSLDGVAVHSAKVYSIRYEVGNSEPIIECISKCGPQGVYIHSFEYTETLYHHDDYTFYRYTQGQHDLEIIENDLYNGVTLRCKAKKKVNGVEVCCSYTTECSDLVLYEAEGESGHYVSCQAGCFDLFEEHDYYVSQIGDNYHTIQCRWCDYYNQESHDYYIYDNEGESVCTLKCYDCDYTLYCLHELYYTNLGSSGHFVECPEGCFSLNEAHNLYMYSAESEDYVVKCRDCSYTVACYEDPEYYGNSAAGHNVDCPGGCYSLFEPHNPESYTEVDHSTHEVVCYDCGYVYEEEHNFGACTGGSASYHYYECTDCGYSYTEAHTFTYLKKTGDVYYHNAYCGECQTTYLDPHTWVSASGGYRCTVCRDTSSTVPGIMSLSDDELKAYLSYFSEDELEAFMATLPENDLARVTAILPPDDERELVTE